jgi:hypothetical protein
MTRGRGPGRLGRLGARGAMAALGTLLAAGPAGAQCTRTFVAKVVAIEQFVWYNRLGAHEPDGLMYVLEQDLVNSAGGAPSWSNHQLRPGKRPRPIVLRANAQTCLKVIFKNWLSATGGELGTRAASVHVVGMQLVGGITDDGSNVGLNTPSGLVEPGQQGVYTLYAEREGTFLMYSTAQTTGGEGDGGQIAQGLFGAVNVEPAQTQWYRSQVTRADLDLATDSVTSGGWPAIDYEKLYPAGHPLAGRPILRMTKGDTIVHSDLYAVITGPGRGDIPASSLPNPGVPVYPERLRPFRENTVIFHDEVGLVQAFDSIFNDRKFEFTLHGGRDAFSINYGTGGIGSEILANRFGLGPMGDCNDCKFEEFFLSSWAVGDPAMVVDNPAAVNFEPQRAAPAGASGHAGLLPRRPVERVPQLPERPREDPQPSRGAQGAPHLPPARPPVAAHPQRQREQLLRQPGHRAGRGATPTRSPTAGAATATTRRATPSTTATSTPTSRRGCGGCGGCTTCSSRAPCWTTTAARPPARARSPTARSRRERPSPRWCRSPPTRWRRCPRSPCRDTPSTSPASPGTGRPSRRSTPSSTAGWRGTW